MLNAYFAVSYCVWSRRIFTILHVVLVLLVVFVFVNVVVVILLLMLMLFFTGGFIS